jgi:hypothetical protein
MVLMIVVVAAVVGQVFSAFATFGQSSLQDRMDSSHFSKLCRVGLGLPPVPHAGSAGAPYKNRASIAGYQKLSLREHVPRQRPERGRGTSSIQPSTCRRTVSLAER